MKKFVLFLTGVLLIVLLSLGVLLYLKNKDEKLTIFNHNKLINEIEKNYNKTVKTNKETNLYIKDGEEFKKAGTISKDFVLDIEKLEKNDIPYYRITSTDYYVSYKDVTKADEAIAGDIRYDKFIPFDNNIVIKKDTKLYLEDETYLTLDEEIEKPLLVKEEQKYGFIYLDKLFYVNKDDVSLKENKNSEEKKASKVLTLTYHFVYDPEEKSCNQSICHTLNQFESHLKYLKENNYFAMRLPELEMFIDGKVNIPYNSIVLTIDDGHLTEKAFRLLEQYETYATLFVITNHFEDFSKFESPYLDLQSHTNSMHKQYACKGMGSQGGGLLCAKEDEAVEDLKISQEKLGGADKVVYLSYPFFDFNDHAIEILKKAGFKMAFIGQWNTKGFSAPGTNKYKVPRLTVFSDMSVDKLKRALTY